MQSVPWRHGALLALAACVLPAALAQDDLDYLLADAPAESPSEQQPAVQQNPAPEPYDTIALPQYAETPPKQKQRRVIEEVVVTAQKTEQSLQDVPISVSTIGGEQAREAAITEAQELVQYTPNVKFSAGANSIPSINIRGFGSPPLGRNLEPSVGLSIDDAFYGRSTFANDAVFDLERLEVLRGPQGTLFGKNTIAGVLNFTTAQPSFETDGYVMLAGGSLNEKRLEGGVSFPILDERLAARLSFRARDRDSGIFNTTRKQDGRQSDIAGRLKLRWLIGDSLSADLGYFAASSRTVGSGFQLEKASERSLERYRRFDPATEADAFDGQQALDQLQFSDRATNGLSLKLQHDAGELGFLGNLKLALIAGQAVSEAPYSFDTDFSPINVQNLASDGPERYLQRSLELRATASTPGPFGLGKSMDWIVGAYGFHFEADVTQFSTFNRNGLIDLLLAGAAFTGQVPRLPQPLIDALAAAGLPADISQLPNGPPLFGPTADNEFIVNILRIRGDSQALFAQTSWNLSERLSLILGLRYGRGSTDGVQSSQCTAEAGNCFGGPLFAGQQDFAAAGSREESDLSPKLALSFGITDEVTLFGNYARGFKSGGFSGPLLAPVNLQYEPERADSMEVGLKSRLFDDSLVLNATAYRVKFANLQVQIFDGTNISTLNAATATSQGLELDFQWLPPLEFLSLAGSVGLSDVSYDSFPCGPALAGDADTTPECNPENDQDAPATQDLTGRETPFTPKLSASFTPSVKFPLLPRLGIGALIGVDVLHQGEQYLDADLDPQTFQKATTKINARFAMKAAEGPWALIFNAKNLTGEQERALVLDQQQVTGNYVSIPLPDEPLYSLDFRYSFGN